MLVFFNCLIRRSVFDGESTYGYICVAGGSIRKVGAGDVPQELVDDAGSSLIDLNGNCVMPGFTDSHGHLVMLGESLSKLDVSRCASTGDLVHAVRAHIDEQALGAHEWVRGCGLSFAPRLSEFHGVSNPVHIGTADYHGCFAANIPGMPEQPAQVPGGSIRDGMFLDVAMEVHVRPHLPQSDARQMLLLAQRRILQHGITCVHDAALSLRQCTAIAQLIDEGLWHLRVFGMLFCEDPNGSLLEDVKKCNYDGYGGLLTVKAVKFFLDGALGSRGALMIQPYSDDPCTRGLCRISGDKFYELFAPIADLGWQICTHAIGDQSNRDCLDAYARYFNERGLSTEARRRRRFRVEHAQHVHDDDIGKFTANHIIASMQPTHMTSDAPICLSRVGGHRMHRGYRWRSWINHKVRLCFGSDFPVESPDVFYGVHAAITRRPPQSANVDYGFDVDAERLTVVEAFAGFTEWAADAVGFAHRGGKIEPGFVADLVVLDRDPLAIDEPSELFNIKVIQTIIGGSSTL